MVRTKEWKDIFTTGKQDLSLGYETGLGPSGRDQRLYDMRDDPNEFTDLADDANSADVIRDMQARMLDIFQRTQELRTFRVNCAWRNNWNGSWNLRKSICPQRISWRKGEDLGAKAPSAARRWNTVLAGHLFGLLHRTQGVAPQDLGHIFVGESSLLQRSHQVRRHSDVLETLR